MTRRPRSGSGGSGRDQLEGRNVVLAALRASRRVRSIKLDAGARPDDRLKEIVGLARKQGVPIDGVPRAELDRISQTGVHNGVIASAEPLPKWTLKAALASSQRPGDPFVVIVDEVQYEQNLGAILRTAAACGCTAVVAPTRRGAPTGAVVQRVAMGGAEEVPVVREGLNSALATLKRDGFRVVGAEADGAVPLWEADLTGPLAIVMGGEDRGLGPKIRGRCDQVVSIPLTPGSVVSSLNVSVAAGLLMYERLRQTS